MQITDPIADMLTRIRNAGTAKHETVDVPASKMKTAIAQILLDEGYIKSFQIIDDGTQGIIRITLKYLPGKVKAIQGLRRVSKPGLRVYAGADELPQVLKGLGIAIISTSKGVMTDKKARENHIGGEVLAFVGKEDSEMSRIGRAPITVPAGVEVKVDGNHITVKGPKGQLERDIAHGITVELEEGVLHVKRSGDSKMERSLHGLTRTLIHNMVVGVTEGFQKKLEINGVGYRAEKKGTQVVMKLGFSHDVIIDETDDIKLEMPDANTLIVKGIDKQKVGQFAAEVRAKRPPEPYKGKGIKYDYEVVRRKVGKSGKK